MLSGSMSTRKAQRKAERAGGKAQRKAVEQARRTLPGDPGTFWTMVIPVVCSRCGVFDLHLRDTFNMTMVGKVAACPKCGTPCRIPDGIYSSVLAAVRVILLAGTPLVDVKRSIERVLSAPPEDRERVAETIPELNSLRSVLPQKRIELYAFLALIVTILAALIDHLTTPRAAPLDEPTIRRLVDEEIARHRDASTSDQP